ncbi:unnamed protein product [Didymodactylos carnosus]|uniref:N-acetyltransferase domain-containing protein n=1 Tax=Didymodactylos carnosus TaxID=1234261 RepID=A0A8S2DW64_9BILA|nr:unnamed protein product [Didymodactylos carnosus]CAF3786870.1 unnamed protein product [Didymodactylos carnosus]
MPIQAHIQTRLSLDMIEEDSDYSYELLRQTHVEECAKLISEAFVDNEPLAFYSKMTKEEFYDYIHPLIKSLLEEQLSFIVFDKQTNQIVSCLLSGDLYLQHQHTSYYEDDDPVTDLLAELDERFLVEFQKTNKFKEKTILHVYYGATKQDFCGKGIGIKLRQCVCKYARKMYGFQYVIVETSHPATTHIYTKKLIGGKIFTSIDPSTWLWKKNQTYPFKDYSSGPIPLIVITLNDSTI